MRIAFDPAKDAVNVVKHGVSLAEARKIEWETLWAMPDRRRDYGEERIVGFAYVGLRLYSVVFTDRGDVRRIISLRKANGREIKRYAEA
ncbi:MAG: BrnT family toxin [Alphaproteobacteria bacterium]|nr:BrnT family toxin [Alphaproteobacteria bacterium]